MINEIQSREKLVGKLIEDEIKLTPRWGLDNTIQAKFKN